LLLLGDGSAIEHVGEVEHGNTLLDSDEHLSYKPACGA